MSGSDKDRRERLAALGVKSEIPTPEGEEKMSAVILQVAEPLLKQHGKSAERVQAIISLTVAGWNQSMFPPEKQSLIEKELIEHFVPKDGPGEDIAFLLQFMDIIVERRKKLFPDLRKIIVDYKVILSGHRLTLNVTSAPLPTLN